MHDRLEIVSAERIGDELTKLLTAPVPSRGLELVVSTGLAQEFLPELAALQLEQDPVHKHKDVLHHTFAVVEKTEADPDDPTLRLAALLHDVGQAQDARDHTRRRARSTTTRSWARGWLANACRRCGTRAHVVDDVRPARRDAPALPRLHRVERQRGPPVRPGRGAAARPAEPAHPSRLHDAEPVQGEEAGGAAGRPGGTDRAPGRGGEPRRDAPAARRRSGDGTPRDPAGAARWDARSIT